MVGDMLEEEDLAESSVLTLLSVVTLRKLLDLSEPPLISARLPCEPKGGYGGDKNNGEHLLRAV